jgi:hypothetical protein
MFALCRLSWGRLIGAVLILQGCSVVPPPPAELVGSWQLRQPIRGVTQRHVLDADGAYRLQELGAQTNVVVSDERGRYWVENGLLVLDPDGDGSKRSTNYLVAGDLLNTDAYAPIGEHDDIVGVWRHEHDSVDSLTKRVVNTWIAIAFDSDNTAVMTTSTEPFFPTERKGDWAKTKDGRYSLEFHGEQPIFWERFAAGLVLSSGMRDRVK